MDPRRARIKSVAARLGYTPNHLARSLILRRSNMVGVIATRASNRGNPDVVHTIGEALQAIGRNFLFIGARSNGDVQTALRDATGFPLDGLIVCTAVERGDILPFLDRGVPVVMNACRLDLHWPVPNEVSVVGFDDVAEAARPTYDLTTVRQHVGTMAKRAVELLRQRAVFPDAPARTILAPGEIVRRGSARIAAC